MKKTLRMILLILIPCALITTLTVWAVKNRESALPVMAPPVAAAPEKPAGGLYLIEKIPATENPKPAAPKKSEEGGIRLELCNVLSRPGEEKDNRLDLIDIGRANPEILIDLPYATANNFTGKAVYDFDRALLRRPAYEKLEKASAALLKQGYRLKVWDALRPVFAQEILWNAWPDANFIADPRKGSSHNRGVAVDVTLCDLDGNELLMPTGFDDFSARADRNYDDVPEEAAKNAKILEKAMVDAGFKPYAKEWWHYHDPIIETLSMPLVSDREIFKEKKIEIRLNAAGDCVIGDDSRYSAQHSFSGLIKKGKSYESFTDGVRKLFPEGEINLVNFESVAGKKLQPIEKPKQNNGEYWFKGDPDFIEILTAGNISAASVANNHALDFGEAGFSQTVENLLSRSIAVCGYGNYAILESGPARVGLLSYNLLGPIEEGEDLNEIKKALLADLELLSGFTHVQVVSFHWGIEYGSVTKSQEEMARFAVDAGADAVIGHHPHVLQKMESYKGKPIFYSLGNFIYGGSIKPRVQAVDSCVAHISFELDPLYRVASVKASATPILTSVGNGGYNTYSPVLAAGADAERILKTLAGT